MTGTLYLVPVALGDTPWEAALPRQTRDIACGLDHFIVENAKTARAELKRLGYARPLQGAVIAVLPESPAAGAVDALLAPALEGHAIGLMSEAGCPGVADPGAAVVRRAHELGIPVVPLVGPSSILLALMASGLEGQRFAFHGYLPVPEEALRKRIAQLEREARANGCTQIFIETPYRNERLFRILLDTAAAATLICVASNLTLPDQEVATRTAEAWRRREAPGLARRPTVFLLAA